MHKAGFVNIVGNPNVGKSTLMNRLVGEKISIITSKSQTTRHRIKGIVNTDDYQIVFSDTPGVVKPSYKMQEYMLEFSKSALVDADIILYVTDVVENIEKNLDFIDKVNKSDIPVLLVSATENFNVDNLYKRIVELLPEGEPFFPKDELTDLPSRFFVNEIIREKILQYYDKEVPYSVEVEVEEFKEDDKRINIMAVIYVERSSQKGIIIGSQGEALKKVGTQARLDIEAFFGKKVFLNLYVKVLKDWRNKDSELKNFGYANK